MKLRQTIGFSTSTDGTRIALASCGEGPVILRAAHWLSHVDYDLESPVWPPWVEALSARNRPEAEGGLRLALVAKIPAEGRVQSLSPISASAPCRRDGSKPAARIG